MVKAGGDRVIGQRAFDLWGSPRLDSAAIEHILQLRTDDQSRLDKARAARFRECYVTTVDLPGKYYLEVVDWLFKRNRIAQGQFVALGKQVNLSALHLPVFLLAARDDEFVAPGQVLGAAGLLGTKAADIRQAIAPYTHLSLFMGAATLRQIWPRIVRWLRDGSTNVRRTPRKGRARLTATKSS